MPAQVARECSSMARKLLATSDGRPRHGLREEPAGSEMRPTGMRSTPRQLRLAAAFALAAFALTGCGSSGGGGGGANASCVGPYLDDQPPGSTTKGSAASVAPGETLTVHGHWYTSTCNDTGGHDPMQPLPPVRLTLTLPDGQVQRLGQFSPGGEDMGFSTAVQIPSGTPGGTAAVRDDRDPQAAYEIVVVPAS
jgi:hypothetical protein